MHTLAYLTATAPTGLSEAFLIVAVIMFILAALGGVWLWRAEAYYGSGFLAAGLAFLTAAFLVK